jgi:hypothetical protein
MKAARRGTSTAVFADKLGAKSKDRDFRGPLVSRSEVRLTADEAASDRPSEPADCRAVGIPMEPWAIPSASVKWTSVEPWPIEPRAVIAVIPRASADEDAANEPLRTIIAARGAGIGIVAVVTVGANRRRSHISGANSNPYDNPSVGGKHWYSQ